MRLKASRSDSARVFSRLLPLHSPLHPTWNRHVDWVSCCTLVPPSTGGAPPTCAVSGSRDGAVRIWSRSPGYGEMTYPDTVTKADSAYAGGGGMGVGPASVGEGGWSCASIMSTAHGSSEFVTCSAGPGTATGSAGGWVATGGTDWTVSWLSKLLFLCAT